MVGLGFGGWVAAELATFAQSRLRRLTLVNPMGLKPDEGEILDQFLISHEDYVRAGFYDPATFTAHFGEQAPIDQLIAWDEARETTTRIAWKPYMFNRALPHLPPGVTVPTLIASGMHDRIVPPACVQHYCEALANARIERLPAGHWLEIEAAAALAKLVVAHEAEA
jgi:pimeloyl-ACP methyl ester carboxylesterase